MKGQISQYILVVGVLVVVAITIFSTSTFLKDVELPADYQQNLTGGHEQTARQLAELAERCWAQGRQGDNLQYIDCFQVHVNLTAAISEEDIAQRLEQLPRESFRMSTSLSPGRHTLKVSYLPESGVIEIRRF